MNEEIESENVRIHSRADELIACLEGEIAKRDEELAACRVAVENCDLFRARIADLEHRCGMYGLELTNEVERRLQAERQLSALKAQEPVAELLRGQSAIGTWFDLNVFDQTVPNGTKLYAEPVSEAKAKGVVQWPDADEIMQMAFEEGQPADDASGYCFELEEFDLFIERLMSEVARLNAAPVQQVSVPDERIIPTSAELIQWAWEEEPEETRFQEGYNAAKRWVKMQIEAGIAAPAAPAADAGVTDHD